MSEPSVAVSVLSPTTVEMITLAAQVAGNLNQTMFREDPLSHTAAAIPNAMSILQAALGAAKPQAL